MMTLQSIIAVVGLALTILGNAVYFAYRYGKKDSRAAQSLAHVQKLEGEIHELKSSMNELRSLVIAFMLGLDEVPSDLSDPNEILRFVSRARANKRGQREGG